MLWYIIILMLDCINDYIISMVFRWFSSSLLTVLKAPTATGITVALIFRNFCTCNLKSWYLVNFSFSFTLVFWSQGTPMSWILHSLFSLSVTTMFSLRSSISLSVCIAKSQGILHFSFSSAGSSWCKYHLSSHSFVFKFVVSLLVLISSKDRTWTDNREDTFNFLFAKPAQRGHNLVIYAIFTAFFLKVCCWAAHIRLSVSQFRSLAFNHCHLLWSCNPSISPTTRCYSAYIDCIYDISTIQLRC